MGRIVELALAAMIPAAAAADMLDARDPEALAGAMRSFGLRVELTVDGQGDPLILWSASGAGFVVYFHGCEDGAECRHILLQSRFALPAGSASDAANTWNRDQLVGTAFFDGGGDPYLEYFVTLDGGVGRETFWSVLDLWEDALGGFRSHLRR